MKLVKLIADSGGTKTDWKGTGSNGEEFRYTSQSYHVANFDEDFFQKQGSFWSTFDLIDCQLLFYGAGCLGEENQLKTKAAMAQLGFQHIRVKSDLYLAAEALELNDGWGAICGTGSVVFKIEHDQLIELRGGKGWQLGDEGSGFYFGKLVVEELIKSPTKFEDIREIINEWMPLSDLVNCINTPVSRDLFAQLPKVLSLYKDDERILAFHQQNVQRFFELYTEGIFTLSLIGGYAYNHQSIFNQVASEKNIRVQKYIQRPLDCF